MGAPGQAAGRDLGAPSWRKSGGDQGVGGTGAGVSGPGSTNDGLPGAGVPGAGAPSTGAPEPGASKAGAPGSDGPALALLGQAPPARVTPIKVTPINSDTIAGTAIPTRRRQWPGTRPAPSPRARFWRSGPAQVSQATPGDATHAGDARHAPGQNGRGPGLEPRRRCLGSPGPWPARHGPYLGVEEWPTHPRDRTDRPRRRHPHRNLDRRPQRRATRSSSTPSAPTLRARPRASARPVKDSLMAAAPAAAPGSGYEYRERYNQALPPPASPSSSFATHQGLPVR